ncbi:hypothetical protein E4U44_007874 [Claviceps purpurea]|nr:hypothetical protein E4U44_007874 [Claviceps purpurea]
MEGNGAVNGAANGARPRHPAFVPQDPDRRALDPVTGEPIGSRHLLSDFHDHFEQAGFRAPGAPAAERIIEARQIPRWPESSPGGTAYVLHVSDLRKEDIKEPWVALQYGTKRANRWKTTSAILGGTEVFIRKSTCTGIMHCPHLARTLLDASIFSNSETYWREFQRVRMTMNQDFESQALREAVSWAWVIKTDYATRKACSKVANGQLESCEPRIVDERNTLPGMRQNRWVICANSSGGESDCHQKAWWEPRFDIFDSQIRRILTSNDTLPCDDACYVVDSKKRAAPTCVALQIW